MIAIFTNGSISPYTHTPPYPVGESSTSRWHIIINLDSSSSIAASKPCNAHHFQFHLVPLYYMLLSFNLGPLYYMLLPFNLYPLYYMLLPFNIYPLYYMLLLFNLCPLYYMLLPFNLCPLY